MVQRTVALYEDRLIGIESLYTVIQGKKINDPVVLKDLRAKSRAKQLCCPCGCGAKLILVAGDRNLREQHFRMKDAKLYPNCRAVNESPESIQSKVVLKCWLDDKLNTNDIETRVPICKAEEHDRKYEFSFLSRKKKVAVNYCYDRTNLDDEKLQILDENQNDIRIIHIVDSSNGDLMDQYPEWTMMIQQRQKYVLLLHAPEDDYAKARLKAVFYGRNLDGLWREQDVIQGKLSEFEINEAGEPVYRGITVREYYSRAHSDFIRELQEEQIRRQEAQRKAEEERLREQAQRELEEKLRQERAEAERQLREQIVREAEQERRRLQEQTEMRLQQAREEMIRQRAEQKQEQEEQDRYIRQVEANALPYADYEQNDYQIRDENNNRWLKCRYCGLIASDSEFVVYGGSETMNLGRCRKCDEQRLHRQAVN